MKVFPLPLDTLEPTLVTLWIITKSLTAAYSSSSTQTLLIHLVSQISRQLHAHLMQQDRPFYPPPDQGAQNKEEEGDVIQEIPVGATDAGGAGASISNTITEYILPMLQALLDVIGTIAHPDSIEEAKNVVATIRDDFTAYDVHTDAVKVLAKVWSFSSALERLNNPIQASREEVLRFRRRAIADTYFGWTVRHMTGLSLRKILSVWKIGQPMRICLYSSEHRWTISGD